jgi:hypothetical protein
MGIIVKNIILISLFLALAAHGQQQRIAILGAEDDGEPPIGHLELTHLTDKLREIAGRTLPTSRYGIMTQQSIVARLGGTQEQAAKVCKEATCLVDLGRRISADNIAQARIGRFGENLTIKVELYDVRSGNLISSFTENSKDVQGLLSILEAKASTLFRTMPGVSSVASSAAVPSGITVEESSGTYALDFEKRYLVHLNTEPEGATLSFDGRPIASCNKTPCKVALLEGGVRIVAALEQYEDADTTIFIRNNEQNIALQLKSNFGVLEIKPAYSENIGTHEDWNLSVNGKPSFSWRNELLPGKYAVKLSHGCYEDINFEAGINKGKTEIFNMAAHIKIKQGGLSLNAERHGELVSEPVFMNDRQVGKTPFDGLVPLCSKIEIGIDREAVDVRLAQNETIEHTHNYSGYAETYSQENTYASFPETTPYSPRETITYSQTAFNITVLSAQVKSLYSKEDREVSRNSLSFLFGVETLNLNSSGWGFGLFAGGGSLFGDASAGNLGEFIFGVDVKKLFWILEHRMALSASLGLAARMHFAYMRNSLVAEFIDEPAFLIESEEYLNDARTISQNNFDIMPAIDLQFFINNKVSLYAGYMYRITMAGDWTFKYKILGKNYGTNEDGDSYDVPEQYSPLKNPRENIFGIPGILRLGMKIH